MSEPLDELYLNWLYNQVASPKLKNPARTYWTLLRTLYQTEFIWFVPNDDNRLEDGRDLRTDFIEQEHIRDVDHNWLTLGCSLLEMLLGLSQRLVFESGEESSASEWFWHMLDNINLAHFNDRDMSTEQHRVYVQHTLDTVIWRNYRSDGLGGLFPLKRPREDQRKVELWYQLSHYLLEGHTA